MVGIIDIRVFEAAMHEDTMPTRDGRGGKGPGFVVQSGDGPDSADAAARFLADCAALIAAPGKTAADMALSACRSR